MSKIEEILNKYRDITKWPEYPEITEDEYIQAMKEYAEWYAKECLEIAAENAETEWGYGCDYDVKIVNKSTILNIDLPKHE